MEDNKPSEKKVNQSSSNDITALKKQLADQQGKIDSIWNLVSDKKRVEQIIEENTALKKQATEKNSMLMILKDKLTEKASSLKVLEENNKNMQQDLETYKKQIFEFDNKIGAVEKRVYSTDEHNQKLLYELMRYKERLKEVDTDISEKDKLIEMQSDQFSKKLDSLKHESDDNKLTVMKIHSKKMAVLHATIDSLKAKIHQQNKIAEEKLRKESVLISEFNSKMSDLLSAGNSVDLSGIEASLESIKSDDDETVTGHSIDLETKSADKKEHQEFSMASHAGSDYNKPTISGPSRIDEIIPMIELAMDHGDNVDMVKHSLTSSGYSEADINDAFSKLNIVINKQ